MTLAILSASSLTAFAQDTPAAETPPAANEQAPPADPSLPEVKVIQTPPKTAPVKHAAPKPKKKIAAPQAAPVQAAPIEDPETALQDAPIDTAPMLQNSPLWRSRKCCGRGASRRGTVGANQSNVDHSPEPRQIFIGGDARRHQPN